ncbi:glycosyltransferase [Methylobacterium dankookense]|uniref:Glycosyl transferase family 1 domain-containing protein n=1 Tax=Methylobacterium dankookense TaxID=560405 RepID=A0A564G6D7_9HYPH|nr:glycosyltransferase [Methylobacterium dankookense]GJD57892.1 hypothetical protein IFDJLNFL_3805 [Methylobacterium dankookense]VUF16123.1 hypothetical protein MTDSW087_05880 [Methylobacterium dankookense]
MKKVLFIDHKFHEHTKSSRFFVELLKRRFHVSEIFVDPHLAHQVELFSQLDSHDIVVVWQMDFLASAFCAYGKPTVVIPMYDGSNSMPDIHWALLKRAKFINFSLALHERTRLLGCESYLAKYFVEPCPADQRAKFETIDVFFWQRRPDHGINLRYVEKMLGSCCDRFHLHNAPDIDLGYQSDLTNLETGKLTVSKWLPSKQAYSDLLSNYNVFVCPRVAEGIGVAMLEAMSRGMIVIAHDQPTHSEYISNWVNGILFNVHAEPSEINFREEASRIGYSAWKTAEHGYRQWTLQSDEILDFIETAEPHDAVEIDHHWYAKQLGMNFGFGQIYYEQFLEKMAHNLLPLAGGTFDDLALLVGDYKAEFIQSHVPSVQSPDYTLNISQEDCAFLDKGWSSFEPFGYRWVEGTYATLRFSGLVPEHAAYLTFSSKSITIPEENQFISIDFNGKRILSARISSHEFQDFKIRIPGKLFATANFVEIRLLQSAHPDGDSRSLSACFSDFKFEVETP